MRMPRSSWLGSTPTEPRPTQHDLIHRGGQFAPAKQDDYERQREPGRTVWQAYDEAIASWSIP